MSLIPTIYSSTDSGAPQLSGTTDALTNLLRAILVSGYGSGVNAKPGLGWTEAFTAAGKAVFRNSPVTGTGFYLRVLDDGSASAGGSARSASVRAYSTMTDIDTGSDPTPTTAQRAIGSIWPKSATADGVSRRWWAIGNERCFYLFICTSSSYQQLGSACVHFAGDLLSYKPADGFCYMVSSNSTSETSYSGSDSAEQSLLFASFMSYNNDPQTTKPVGYVGRGYGGTGSAIAVCMLYPLAGGQVVGSGEYPYPYPLNNGMLWEQVQVHEARFTHRGVMPGIIAPLHSKAFGDLEELSDLPGMPAGAKLLAKRFTPKAPFYVSTVGQVLFDIYGEWK